LLQSLANSAREVLGIEVNDTVVALGFIGLGGVVAFLVVKEIREARRRHQTLPPSARDRNPANEQRTAATSPTLTNRQRLEESIYQMIATKKRAIFPDLMAIPGFRGGGITYEVPESNIVLWRDLTPDAVHALNELLEEKRIALANTYYSSYKRAGHTLELPLAITLARSSEIRWFPVEFRLASPEIITRTRKFVTTAASIPSPDQLSVEKPRASNAKSPLATDIASSLKATKSTYCSACGGLLSGGSVTRLPDGSVYCWNCGRTGKPKPLLPPSARTSDQAKEQRAGMTHQRSPGESMNLNQLVALWIGISLMVGCGLFPPWTQTLDLGEGGRATLSGGYHFILNPPRMGLLAATMDVPRLMTQWVVIGLVFAGAFFTLRGRRS